ncbi:putative 2-C-methyl-D-erythritol 4-phosphate cytidylyltransferase [Pillotina sp. SPG140]|jgi:2-C-methyl-D-erythritol 4-phosphate cytidylyltransferase
MANAVIICAAGSSSRMHGLKKEYQYLPGQSVTVLETVLRSFSTCPRIDRILVTVPPGEEALVRAMLSADLLQLPFLSFVAGDSTRQRSVYKALSVLQNENPQWVVIHDGARPWLDSALINRVLDTVQLYKAVIPVIPFLETPKEVDESHSIVRHIRRSSLYVAQTPQAFSFQELLSAHIQALEQADTTFTDDSELWGKYVGTVMTVPGSIYNKKITFPEDLIESLPLLNNSMDY